MTTQQPAIGVGAITTACTILELQAQTNADIEKILLEFGLSEDVQSQGSISKTMLELNKFAKNYPDCPVKTDLGEKPLSILLVEEAIRRSGVFYCEGEAWGETWGETWGKLERYLNLDGYTLLKKTYGGLRKFTGITVAMPQFSDLHKSSSELDILLDEYELCIAKKHLGSARENITQSDWVSANSQCRTFLEALTDGIADRLYPSDSKGIGGGLPKRQLLAREGFLSQKKHEFSNGKGQAFLPGLTKLLHSDGAHPGDSTQHDAMFRLQVVVVTALWLLRRMSKCLGGAG